MSVTPEGGAREIRAVPIPHAQHAALHVAPVARPYMLSRTDADRAHYPCWDDAEIETFTVRAMLFIRRGINATDADDLAKRLTLRDRDQDERRLCLECKHHAPGRCGNHRRAGLNAPGLLSIQ